jgi:uncharacterized protein YfaS (alpha-2-macroglobulin family)
MSPSSDFQSKWDEVKKADNEGLPKTAVEVLDSLVEQARESRNYPWLLRGLTARWTRKAQITGDVAKERIVLAEKELPTADKRVKPLLHTVLAAWYWDYYSNNRYRFQNRSATKGLDDTDFTTWDLPKLFNQIDFHYKEALKPEIWLKKMKISLWQPFIEAASSPEGFRPTLYDFIAHEALKFYESNDQPTPKAFDAFELDCDSDVFATASRFMEFKPDTSDSDSPMFKAIDIYQRLIAFHLQDGNTSATLQADLDRLDFARAKSYGANKDTRYKDALKIICKYNTSSPVVTLAYWKWAQLEQAQADFVEAIRVATLGAELHSSSVGSQNCRSLIQNIQMKSLSLKSERTVVPGTGTIATTYKNIREVHFRIYEDKWDHFTKYSYPQRPDNFDNDQLEKILNNWTPVKSWSVSLSETTDYKENTVIENLPELKPGFYRVVASWRKDFYYRRRHFSSPENAVSATSFWVSNITLVARSNQEKIDGLVLDSITGEPISGVSLDGYRRNNNKWNIVATAKTDSDGRFVFSGDNMRSGIMISAYYNGHRSILNDEIYSYRPRSFYHSNAVRFFTDRAIYRPGQSIKFKGIAYQTQQGNEIYKVVPDSPVSVVFSDRNGQKIDSLDLTTNEFGSFSGVFIAPANVLTGTMTLRATGAGSGYSSVKVEEYKRPKFIVNVDKPSDGGQLGGLVKVSGTAASYTGAPVDGAKVRYRVTRECRYPSWYYYWWSPPAQAPQEITHGMSKTKADGTFTIDFEAKPDLTVDKSSDPAFTYAISVDVIDQTGETRTGSTSVRLGYKAMEISLSTKEWLTSEDSVDLSLSARTLDGKPLKSTGTIEIFSLKNPAKPVPEMLYTNYRYYRRYGNDSSNAKQSDPSNWKTWEDGILADSSKFETSETGSGTSTFKLKPGAYRARVKSTDRFGNEISSFHPFMVISTSASSLNVAIPNLVQFKSTSVEVGSVLETFWGTGYDSGRAYIEVEHKDKIVKSFWTKTGVTQNSFLFPVSEEYRGGFIVHFTFVRENRVYSTSRKINVPWTNKDLHISFESFRSILKPGQKETWKLKIRGDKAEIIASEMVATLYDSSLDSFVSHTWSGFSNLFYSDSTRMNTARINNIQNFNNFIMNWNQGHIGTNSYRYWQFPSEVVSGWRNYGYNSRVMSFGGKGMMMKSMAMLDDCESDGMVAESMPAPMMAAPTKRKMSMGPGMAKEESESLASSSEDIGGGSAADKAPVEPNLDNVAARTNMAETAMFEPQLIAESDGSVTISFEAPDTLTKWSFMAFAHGKGLESGMARNSAVTRKDLMVRPTPPRFLREKDEILFSAKVVNMSEEVQSGKVRLTLKDALSESSWDRQLANNEPEQAFSIKAGQSKAFFWKLKVPVGAPPLLWKVVAASAKNSDGEESILPVLSGRVLVTESLPLPVRGPVTKKFVFRKLLESDSSKTIDHKLLSVQMVSNPAWYAIQALPYLMEYPHECSEQTFNRLYANAIAKHIANSDPRIRKVFDAWKGTDALKSNLQKNEHLKSVLLKETPWVLDAKNEEQAKNNVGILFEDKRLNTENDKAMKKLADLQMSSGAWPWFPGGKENEFITLYLMTGFGRLKHLEIGTEFPGMSSCLSYCDNWLKETYDYLVSHKLLDHDNLTSSVSLYLYGRSFFLNDQKVSSSSTTALNYYLKQAKEHWLSRGLMTQGHLALATSRFGDSETPKKVIASLREKATHSEEMGMYWAYATSWWWYSAPVETQAVMIELFQEIAKDDKVVDDCQVWLLKQKQTQNWKTTKSTADAVYALLMRGDDLLASSRLVEVEVGGVEVKPARVEAGTGAYERIYNGSEVKAAMGNITVTKHEKGVAWGSVNWQYFEDLDKVTPHETPLQLEKTIFVERQTDTGPVIEPLGNQTLTPGDKLKVRIVLKVDRAMEYIHMKDQRGSGTEPINVLSSYKWQDGLGYYEATGDTATNFFIDYLPKGTFVFEYPLSVVLNGKYQSGMATIQCMYAPEFNSHSGSRELIVKPTN